MFRVVTLVVIACFGGMPCRAQQAEEADDAVLEVGLSGVLPVGHAYGDVWVPQPGGALQLATGFYGGRAHAALHAFMNEVPSEQLPDFVALRAEVGWGPEIALPAGLRLTPALAVGALHMRFDEDEDFAFALRDETELTAGGIVRLQAPVARRVQVFAAAEWTHVYTAVPTDLTFVRAGLSLAMTLPTWLRCALQ